MSAKPVKAWYGVRTMYRVTADGIPKSRDGHFDPESSLIEDRVVLFQAIGFDDAIAQGTKEARAYCRQTRSQNIYGQERRMRFLGACDAYEIFEMARRTPAAGSEVYSSTELVRASVSDSAVVRRRMGPKALETAEVRAKFVDGRILRKALGMVAQGNRADVH